MKASSRAEGARLICEAMAEVKTKVLAGLALMCVQTTVGVLYKVSQHASGGFKYSTMSAVAIAEFVKLCISVSAHVSDRGHHAEGKSKVATAWNSAKTQLPLMSVAHIMTLSFLYAANNQLSFYVYRLVDPGTVFLFKAASTLIVAGIQVVFVGKRFSFEQWKAMVQQALGSDKDIGASAPLRLKWTLLLGRLHLEGIPQIQIVVMPKALLQDDTVVRS